MHEGDYMCCNMDYERREMWEVMYDLRYACAMMRRTLAALTREDIEDMDNSWAVKLIGRWWEKYLLPDDWHTATTEHFEVKRFKVPEWSGWITDSQLNGRMTPPGSYVGLYQKAEKAIDTTFWMGDTPSEMIDHYKFFELAQGDVLVTGLGLGWIVYQLLNKECVNSVTVIERELEVVQLTAPNFESELASGKLKIIVGDANTHQFAPATRFNYVWHDIWSSISEDNLDQMDTMREHYAPWVRMPYFYTQFCWAEDYFRCLTCGWDNEACTCCRECGAMEMECDCEMEETC